MPELTKIGPKITVDMPPDDLSLTSKMKRDLLGGDNLTVDDPNNPGDDSGGGGDSMPLIPLARTPDPGALNDVDKQMGLLTSKAGETFVGDTFDILILFHKVAQNQRAIARESRDVAREAQYAAIAEQAGKMREAANFALAAGIVTGAASIISGAISLGAASDAARSIKASEASKTFNVDGSVKNIGVKDMSDQILATGKARGQITEGVGQMFSAMLNYGAGQAGADQKGFEKDEAKAKAQVDNESELASNMMDIMRDARQKMQEIANAQTESLRSIMRA